MHPTLRLGWAAGYTLKMCQIAMARKALGASDEVVRDLTKEWALGLSSRMGIEVRAHGIESVDWSKPYVLMANHQSYLDVLALYTALPQCFGIVAKKPLFAVPFFGGVMRALGCVPVDRSKHTEAIRAMRDASAEIRRRNMTIAVFPEGTRGAGDRVGTLKKGPFHLAQLAQVPTLPVGIRGTAALMPRENTGIRPGIIEVHVGRPLAPPPPEDGGARTAAMHAIRAEIARLAGMTVGSDRARAERRDEAEAAGGLPERERGSMGEAGA
jgi:1-acyl-sn-glycerol-3-phosphate acyltransferase